MIFYFYFILLNVVNARSFNGKYYIEYIILKVDK